jgi:hypothetical protein
MKKVFVVKIESSVDAPGVLDQVNGGAITDAIKGIKIAIEDFTPKIDISTCFTVTSMEI